jgi:hypothetical protein
MDARALAEQRMAEKMHERWTTLRHDSQHAYTIPELLGEMSKLAAEEIAKAAEYMHPKPWPEHEEMERMWARVCADAESAKPEGG